MGAHVARFFDAVILACELPSTGSWDRAALFFCPTAYRTRKRRSSPVTATVTTAMIASVIATVVIKAIVIMRGRKVRLPVIMIAKVVMVMKTYEVPLEVIWLVAFGIDVH